MLTGKKKNLNANRDCKHTAYTHTHPHTYLVAVMFRGAAAVTVSGRWWRHHFATWLLFAHRCLVSVETVATEITAELPGASLWPLKATPQQSALKRKVKPNWCQGSTLILKRTLAAHNSGKVKTERNLLTVCLINQPHRPKRFYFRETRHIYPE